jgi:hypothetical protein
MKTKPEVLRKWKDTFAKFAQIPVVLDARLEPCNGGLQVSLAYFYFNQNN